MTAPFIARLMVTAVATVQGVRPLFVDLNRTHATNPLWTGHARFHVVDQAIAMAALASVEIAMLWWMAPGSRLLFYVATILTALPIVTFLIAMFTSKLYGGTLHDPNGVRPLRIVRRGVVREVDMNVMMVSLGAAVLLVASLLY
jgi:hypothetical protein